MSKPRHDRGMTSAKVSSVTSAKKASKAARSSISGKFVSSSSGARNPSPAGTSLAQRRASLIRSIETRAKDLPQGPI